MAETPLPIRLPFASEAGARAGYWYLRALDGHGFRLSWWVKSVAREFQTQDVATAEEAVALLGDKLNAFFGRQYEGYQKLIVEIQKSDPRRVPDGFRPGYFVRESKKALRTHLANFQLNEDRMGEIQELVKAAGWPPLVNVKLPWTL